MATKRAGASEICSAEGKPGKGLQKVNVAFSGDDWNSPGGTKRLWTLGRREVPWIPKVNFDSPGGRKGQYGQAPGHT